MIYKKSIFQLRSKYVCEMMEGNLEIKDCQYDVGEVNLINWENILKHNKDRKYRYIHVGSVQVQITPLQYYGKDIDLYALLCDIRHTKFNNQIITGIKTNLCNGSVGFNCRPGYYVSLKDEFAKNFLSLKIKTVGMDMKRGGYPLRIFWKIIYKLDNTIDPKTKVTMIEAEKFESPTPMQKIQRIKSHPQDIRIDKSWINSFVNPTKINKKNVIKIDENGKITIKPQLLRSMSAKSEWKEGSFSAKEENKDEDAMSMASEMSRMSFEPARHSVDCSMSLDRKVIGYKTRTISEPIYEDELLKNLTMEIWYEATKTNPNSIYIPIKICLEGYNPNELTAYIDSGCSVCFGKRSLFPEFMWKTAKKPLQVRIADNSIMSHTEAIEGLTIELGGINCVIPVLWATNQPSHDMIIGNNFQRLYSPCTQTQTQIIFTINGHSVPINKLDNAYTHQKIEFTCSQRGEKVIPAQREIALSISLLEMSIKEQILERQEELCKELYSDNPLKFLG